uniref:Transmembrane protein n=1 Tax=viral metagenome TaxID=1070528 RepID=A0A6C0KTE8_9ZZZZ
MQKLDLVLFILFIVAIPVLSFVFYNCRKQDNFDITTDPLKTEYNYTQMDCATYPTAKRNGLNTESNNNIDICSFNKQFNSKTTFAENVNQSPCSVTARQLCSVLYSNHQEYFTNMWSGLGECEVYQTEQCKKCPEKLKIEKQSDYFGQVPNL